MNASVARATTQLRARSRFDDCSGCQARKQRIMSHLNTIHTRSSVITRQRAGQVEIERVEVDPANVTPGGQVAVTVNLRETAAFVGTGPELCNPPNPLSPSGIAVILTVSLGDQQLDREVCVPVNNLTSGSRDPTFRLTAPSLPKGVTESQERIDVSMQIRGKPNRSTSTSRIVTVTQQGRQQPRNQNGNNGNNGNNGGIGPLLPCFLDPNRSCTRFETIAFGGLGVLMVILIAGTG